MRSLRAKVITNILILLVACCQLLVGCKQEDDPKSGGDNSRGSAQLVPIGLVITDVLSPDLGDHTDWKSFAIPAKGVLAIRVYWDSADKIRDTVVTIHDKYGIQLAERVHDPLVAIDELLIRVDQGYYFLRLKAAKGDSIYSIQARHLLVSPSGDDEGDGDSIPEFAGAIEIEGLGPASPDAEAGADAAAQPAPTDAAVDPSAALSGDTVVFEDMNLGVIDDQGLVEESVELGGGGGGGGGGSAPAPEPVVLPEPVIEPDPVPAPSPGLGGSPTIDDGMGISALGNLGGGEGPGLGEPSIEDTMGLSLQAPTEVAEAAPSQQQTHKVPATVTLIAESQNGDGGSIIKIDVGSDKSVAENQKGVIYYNDGKNSAAITIVQADIDFSWASVANKTPDDLANSTKAEVHIPK